MRLHPADYFRKKEVDRTIVGDKLFRLGTYQKYRSRTGQQCAHVAAEPFCGSGKAAGRDVLSFMGRSIRQEAEHGRRSNSNPHGSV